MCALVCTWWAGITVCSGLAIGNLGLGEWSVLLSLKSLLLESIIFSARKRAHCVCECLPSQGKYSWGTHIDP